MGWGLHTQRVAVADDTSSLRKSWPKTAEIKRLEEKCAVLQRQCNTLVGDLDEKTEKISELNEISRALDKKESV